MTASWGGARAGAGRPAKGPIASEPHKIRPALSRRHPVHVSARLVPAICALGTRHAHRAIQRAVQTSLARGDFRIVQLAFRGSRLELIVEADDRIALARGMQGFQVAAARALNRSARRSGTVFPDRYRPRTLVTRAAVRAALDRARPAPRMAWPQTWLLVVELATAPSPRSRDPA